MAAFDLGMQCASRVLRAEEDGLPLVQRHKLLPFPGFGNLAQRIHPIRLLRGAGTGRRHHALKRIADIVDALLLPGGRLSEHAFKPLVGGNRQHAHAARLQIGQQVRRGGRNHIEMAACQRHHGFGGGFVGDDAQLLDIHAALLQGLGHAQMDVIAQRGGDADGVFLGVLAQLGDQVLGIAQRRIRTHDHGGELAQQGHQRRAFLQVRGQGILRQAVAVAGAQRHQRMGVARVAVQAFQRGDRMRAGLVADHELRCMAIACQQLGELAGRLIQRRAGSAGDNEFRGLAGLPGLCRCAAGLRGSRASCQRAAQHRHRCQPRGQSAMQAEMRYGSDRHECS